MGTANAGRPGRRPARTPALASKPIPAAPPEATSPAPRQSSTTVHEALAPMPKRLPVPAEVLEMLDNRAIRRVLAAEAWEIRSAFSEEENGFQADPEAGKAGLRQALKDMAEVTPTVAKIDAAMGGSIRYALIAAGILLDRRGAKATLLASMIVGKIHLALMLGDSKGLSELAWQVYNEAGRDFPGTVGPMLSHSKTAGTLSA